jgi:pyruvate dehydrogenase E1 component
MLSEEHDVAADVWSVTSYGQLLREALAAERRNLLNPSGKRNEPFVTSCLDDGAGGVVAVSDYSKALPCALARWTAAPFRGLGTDGFGRSEDRVALRDYFEVDARYITLSALSALAANGEMPAEKVKRAMKSMDIDPDKADPIEA